MVQEPGKAEIKEYLQNRLTFKSRKHWRHVAAEERVCLWTIGIQICRDKNR